MKKLLCALVLLLSAGIAVQAQQNTPPTRPTDPTAQQPAPPPQAQTPDQSRPASDAQAQPSSADGQTFMGTIVKSGDKYKFQDAASGNTYDIDHQEQVKEFEGKKVRVHGTLDESAKMIHVQ